MNATILRAGFLTTVQDLGRTGFREFGVSMGGALDPHALRVVNLLVGNNDGAAGLEIAFGGLRMRLADERTIAWAGGDFEVRAGSTLLPAGHAKRIGAGEEIIFHQAKRGCRSWLAISGGIDVPLVMGSRSTDLRAQFGGLEGRALRDGDRLLLGSAPASRSAQGSISSWSAPVEWTGTVRDEAMLRFVRGADWDRFAGGNLQDFTNTAFVVLPESDRMGVRLEGAPLQRDDQIDLVSEAVAPGTVQVPPGGKPIVLLGDCQTIGGYPKIAHVITVDLSLAAQLRANDRVRFQEVRLAEAHRLLLQREHDLRYFRAGLSLRAT